MPEQEPELDAAPMTRAERRRAEAQPKARPKRRARITFLGVTGELLITSGLLVMLFLGWQLWLNDIIVRAEQDEVAQKQSQDWLKDASAGPTPTPTIDPDKPDAAPFYAPVIGKKAKEAQKFGVLLVPRFGANYAADVAGGVTRKKTLDKIGVGHYLDTQMPGEAGNFAVAAHRTTYGKPLNLIANLRVGDAIVIQTADGWYTYRFRTLEYVQPTAIDVLNPIPQVSDATTADITDAYITLTSCSPMYSAAERIIAFGVFESFTPTAVGKPASLTDPLEG